MFILHAPKASCKFSDLFKDLNLNIKKSATYCVLKMLFVYFIFNFNSSCELVRKNSWSMSHSQFLRILNGFDGNRLMRRMRKSILKKYKGILNPNDFMLAVDDTDNPKYSKYLSGVQSWKGSKGFYYGQKVLVIALVDSKSGFAIPLYFHVCAHKKEQKELGKKNELEIMYDLILETVRLFNNIPVVADSWFDSSELALKLRYSSIVYVWELKSNRKAKIHPGQNIKWEKISDCFFNSLKTSANLKKEKWISTKNIVLKSNNMNVKAVASFNKVDSKHAHAFYASTDLTMSGQQICKIFRERWKIECMFRDLKSHLNFGRISSSFDNINELAFIIPFVILVYFRLSAKSFGLPEGKTIKEYVERIKNFEEERVIDQLGSGQCKDKILILQKRRKNINKRPKNKAPEELYALAA